MDSIPIKNEAIKILQDRNIGEWNDLRKKYPDWIPDLRKADFKNINLERPDLKDDNVYKNEFGRWGANLSNALLQESNFDGANLSYVNFEGTSMRESSFKGANLYRTNFNNTRLNNTNFRDARFVFTNFENADLSGIKYNSKNSYKGIRVSTSYGNAEFKKFAQDQDFLEEFKGKNLWQKIVYYLWLITCNCGRSMLLWIMWSILFAFGFAGIYYYMGEYSFHVSNLNWQFSTLLYYSVVTFTTLGFGDIAPNTSCASYWVMFEVVLGYIMLGGLISIFANKLARRT